MNPQRISIEGLAFHPFRFLMDAHLNRALEKMLAAGAEEGTVDGSIGIRIYTKTDPETGAVSLKPKFSFSVNLSVPVKERDRDDAGENLVLIRDHKGMLKICDEQVSMDDILEDAGGDPDDEEPAEDQQEDADGDNDEEDAEE